MSPVFVLCGSCYFVSSYFRVSFVYVRLSLLTDVVISFVRYVGIYLVIDRSLCIYVFPYFLCVPILSLGMQWVISLFH